MAARNRVRVAVAQYYIRPVESWKQFRAQVESLVATAADYRCRLVVFPEYFTIQLLTIDDISLPVYDQVRRLARKTPAFIEMMTELAKDWGLYIVGGSIPTADPDDEDKIYNDCFVFAPSGEMARQGKLHMTRWESEDWRVSTRDCLQLIETEIGKLAVAICYDVEFPEIARAAAREGCYMLVVPSCTDDRQGFLRVRYCAQARAIENQMYVMHSPTVGSLPQIPSVSLNYGQASILTPSDFPFARDGILAQGNENQEMLVVAEMDLDTITESREHGTVLPLRDSVTTAEVLANMETIRL